MLTNDKHFDIARLRATPLEAEPSESSSVSETGHGAAPSGEF